MLKQHKIHVVGGNYAIERIFRDRGATFTGLKDATIVVFTGGEDVSPDMYGEGKHPSTYSNQARDEFEFDVYRATAGKFRIGICRGAQFLNVMNGGKLWQHVDGHGLRATHQIQYDYTDPDIGPVSRFVDVTSTHHQMMQPNPRIAAVWGVAGVSTFKESGSVTDKVIRTMPNRHMDDVEIVYYASSRSLCFQPHPEYMSESTRVLFFDCVERALAT